MMWVVFAGVVGEIATTAFCEVSGREARLPLLVQGIGLGPKATWLYDTLDIGDVFVNSQHKYEVVLENHGEIEARDRARSSSTTLCSLFFLLWLVACLLVAYTVWLVACCVLLVARCSLLATCHL